MDPPARKKRSVTMINDRTPDELANLHVEFNEDGSAIGDKQSEFTNYCGVRARAWISINIDSWDKVSVAQRDHLWLDIKVTHSKCVSNNICYLHLLYCLY